MSFFSACKDAFVQHFGTWIGVIITAILSVLGVMESTSQPLWSVIGLHNKLEYMVGPVGETRVLYTICTKDFFTALALQLPVFLFCSITWDYMSKYPAAAARNRFCFYLTSGLMLAFSIMLTVFFIFKGGFWTTLDLWWNGLPNGYMVYWVKAYFVMQAAVLCYFLESLACSGLSVASMLDSWIDGLLNLIFALICYIGNFLPQMMIVFAIRLCLQASVSLVQVISLLELSGKRRDYAGVVLRGLRWLTGGEVFFYVALIVANIIYGRNSYAKEACIILPLLTMLGVSAWRAASGAKFDLDQLRAGDDGQAPAPPAPAPAAPTRGKSKRK